MAITANRYSTLFVLFIAASISYAVGFLGGVVFFILVGVVFEIAFWVNLIFVQRRG